MSDPASQTTAEPDVDLGSAIIEYVLWAYGVRPSHDQLTELFHATTDKAQEMFDAN